MFWNWGIQCTRMLYIVSFQCLILFISHVLCRQYVGKADFLVFRTLNQHGFLGQLQEKKLVSISQICLIFFAWKDWAINFFFYIYIFRGWLLYLYKHMRAYAYKSFLRFQSPNSWYEALNMFSILNCAWRPNFTFFG